MSYYARKESFELPNGVYVDIFIDNSIMFINSVGQGVALGHVSNLYPLLEHYGLTVNGPGSLPYGLTWDDAPKWANYAAQDKDSTWYWYENRPETILENWDCEGKVRPIEVADNVPDWKNTLVERPPQKSKENNGKIVEIDGKKYKLEEI